MRFDAVKIQGISVTVTPENKILEEINKYLKIKSSKGFKTSAAVPQFITVYTPNPEQIVFAKSHREFARILNKADISIPDGIGIIIALRLFDNKNHTERIPGVDFAEHIMDVSSKQGFRIGLIGGRSGVAVSAFDCLIARFQGLKGWAVGAPELTVDEIEKLRIVNQSDIEFRSNLDISADVLSPHRKKVVALSDYFYRICELIQITQTNVILVGFGAPKQEYFIDRLIAYMNSQQESLGRNLSSAKDLPRPIILMSVGGAFDIWSGRLRRAPYRLRISGLEWLWRLIQEPWRWRRQTALVKFLTDAVLEKAMLMINR